MSGRRDVAVRSVDVALDVVEPDGGVGQLRALLHLQLPAHVGRLVAGPRVPVDDQRARLDGAVLADARHHRVAGRRAGLRHELAHRRHPTDHH